MSAAPARARLFVALELPARAPEALARWARRLEGPALRLVDPAGLHVTLCFLGWREEGEAESIGRLARECVGSPPARVALALGDAAWLPSRRPRVLAVDLSDVEGAAAVLQARVAAALAAGAGYQPEARPFRPHVTVARVRGGARVRARDPLPETPSLRFRAAAVTLYRSRLSRAGALYEPLARAELG